MTEKRPEDRMNRRGFLSAGLGTATVAATAAVSTVTPAAAAESDADKKKARYQESEHVKNFYRTNRY